MSIPHSNDYWFNRSFILAEQLDFTWTYLECNHIIFQLKVNKLPVTEMMECLPSLRRTSYHRPASTG